MVVLQIVERPSADLYKKLVEAMRSGKLQTFAVDKRGQKVTHISYPDCWMDWSCDKGAIVCEVRSHLKLEWQLLEKLIGRLTDKYSHLVHSINIQFLEVPLKESSGRLKGGRK